MRFAGRYSVIMVIACGLDGIRPGCDATLVATVVHEEVWLDRRIRMRDIHAALYGGAYLNERGDIVDARMRALGRIPRTWSDVFSSVGMVR